MGADLGFTQLFALAQEKPAGLRLGGKYQTATGVTLDFDNDKAFMNACGTLVTNNFDYSVTRRGSQLDIEIATLPAALKLVLGQDGQLRGPAAVDIQGSIIVGYQTERTFERNVSDGTIVPGSEQQRQVPVTAPKTERCGFAALRPTGPVRAQGNVVGLLVSAVSGQPDPASQRAGTVEAPAGPRMGGTYVGASGLKVEFEPTAVILDCGEAHVMRPYAVENSADRLAITVRNGSAPFSLTLRPDGTLNGSGNVEVEGRVLTGTDANGFTFVPRTTRCDLGNLTPR